MLTCPKAELREAMADRTMRRFAAIILLAIVVLTGFRAFGAGLVF